MRSASHGHSLAEAGRAVSPLEVNALVLMLAAIFSLSPMLYKCWKEWTNSQKHVPFRGQDLRRVHKMSCDNISVK